MEQVQRRALLEPLELRWPVGVMQTQRLCSAIRVLDDALDGLARSQVLQSDEADAVVLTDAVVVRQVTERERQQPLLLQVAFVDAGEAADDDRHATKEPRRQSGVFTAAALPVVVITNDDPLQAMGFIVPGDLRDRLSALFPLPVSPVKALVAPMNILSLNLSRWPR